MPSGGARPHSGPRPDPTAVRHGAGDQAVPTEGPDGWTRLPHAGRRKRAPAWPLPGDPDVEVLKSWRREWKRPQALMWERLGLEVEVALYVLRLHQSLEDARKVNLGTLLRQQQQALGLSAPGLHMNRWVIDPAPPPAPKQAPTSSPGASALRSRLQVVPDAPAGE